MQIVILAWWLGTRLRPITKTIPKSMVKINSKPFLEYQILMLKKYDIKNILLLVWYLWNQIEEYFWNWSKFWVNISYNYEKELLWTWWALKLAQEKLENEFVLIYWDSYLDFNYQEFIKYSLNSSFDLVVTAYDNNIKTDVLNNLEVLDWKVLNYKKWVIDTKLNYVEAWVNFVKKDILKFIKKNKFISLEEEMFPILINKWKLWAFVVKNKFYDIWTFSRLEIFKNL